ncbi:hypothetical protein D869_gp032 [Caulobacter phage CcrRogue]|uniref:Uncharacterized protein n=1 Tax=Caulobacter phage CcrRogue TaxID=2927986 RepID=K4JMU7_9CAUD|nr:hypothetical protein D869_gp032 [Caulobacter phage CcrRogue]AFU86514.1 hypothetical protein CcrRogue_gp032 [Caulobacter phage CcrRogue]
MTHEDADMFEEFFPENRPPVKSWGFSKHPRYRAQRVGSSGSSAPPFFDWRVSRRLPLPWVNIYVPLRLWVVDKPGEMPVKRWARYNTSEGAEKFIATKPAFFPKKPIGVLNDVLYFNEQGAGVILGAAKVRKERLY